MEVSALLLAVEWGVGGIEIDDDSQRRPEVRIEKNDVDEQPLDGSRIVVELVMAILTDIARLLHAIDGGECRVNSGQ